MPKNFESDSNNYETACQWAEAELGYLLERESGHYLEQIPNLPEATASGLERFIPTMLGAIAQDQINDPDSVYQMTKTIIEYVVLEHTTAQTPDQHLRILAFYVTIGS